MKTRCFIALIITVLCLQVMLSSSVSGQDSASQLSQMLDLKLQLLESKLELLDTKMKLWESKPQELDLKLTDLDTKINSLDFKPEAINRKFVEIDSMIRKSQEKVHIVEIASQQATAVQYEPEYFPQYKSAIMLDPVRIFEGTFYLTYERIISKRFSVAASGMATYSTEQGISNIYFSNQSFSYFDAISNQYQPFEGEVIAGGGVNVQFRNYLLASHPGKRTAPGGLYAAPQFMYRKNVITGHYNEYLEIETGNFEWVEKEIRQHLNVFAGGVILGMKLPLFKVLTVDIFAGGNIRLSKYADEDGFTRYKDWFNMDFSGVSPVAGVSIGILR